MANTALKLISINIEGRRHYDLVKPFLEREKADVICVMEAPSDFEGYLSAQGYQTTFAPMLVKEQEREVYVQGMLFASTISHEVEVHYYQGPAEASIHTQGQPDIIQIAARPVLFATSDHFTITTTHLTWNPRGESYYGPQAEDLAELLDFLSAKPPHVLCGDMNIPRNINPLSPQLTANYTDAIPAHYASSLDQARHRSGSNPDHRHLFDSFMVDHLLTQPPYHAHDVRLKFGVSDHAAVVATIQKHT